MQKNKTKWRLHRQDSCWKHQGDMDKIYVLLTLVMLHTGHFFFFFPLPELTAFFFTRMFIIVMGIWKILTGFRSSTNSQRYQRAYHPPLLRDLHLWSPLGQHNQCHQATTKHSQRAWLCTKHSVWITQPTRTWLLFSHFTDSETEAQTFIHLPEMTQLESDGAGIKNRSL